MKGQQVLKLGGGYSTCAVGGNKNRTLYVIGGRPVKRRHFDRHAGFVRQPMYPRPIAARQSRRGRKTAIFAALSLRPCWHDDWEIISHGGGGCYEFPEPTWYTRRCTCCGREEAEPDSGWYEPDESWRDYEL